jgi:type II secretory pathway pseudopilin PulG
MTVESIRLSAVKRQIQLPEVQPDPARLASPLVPFRCNPKHILATFASVMEALTHKRCAAEGYGLAGLLVALLVLGGLAAVVLVALPDWGTGRTSGSKGPIPSIANQPAQAQIAAAAQQACFANYDALQQAISVYQVEHGSLPTSTAEVQANFRGSLSTPEFNLGIDPARPGQIQVQTNGHPASDGNGNCRYA